MRKKKIKQLNHRKAFFWIYTNALLWALGNGLVSTTLITYLVTEQLAALPAINQNSLLAGLAISFLLSLQHLVGSLRLATPWMLKRLKNKRRRFTILSFTLSACLLLLIPALCFFTETNVTIGTLILLWAFYHLGEYCGVVTLWSWFGDLIPAPLRGRVIARRQSYLAIGKITGLLLSALVLSVWITGFETITPKQRWQGYVVCAAGGAVVMFLSILPLFKIPHVAFKKTTSQSLHQPPSSLVKQLRLFLQNLSQPLRDPKFRPLLYYYMWFSFFNGITTYPRFVHYRYTLQIDFRWIALFTCLMLFGQMLFSPFVGRRIDRIGNKKILIISQCIVSTGMLFFFFATPAQPFLVAGAWVAWIGYAGLNIGLTHAMLQLAPATKRTSYNASYFTLGGLFVGFATLGGGVLVHYSKQLPATNFLQTTFGLTPYETIFLGGFLGLLLGNFILLRLPSLPQKT